MQIEIGPDTIIIDGKRINMSVFRAMIDPDQRTLWRFVEQNGVLQAVPYSEDQVIWIQDPEPKRSLTR